MKRRTSLLLIILLLGLGQDLHAQNRRQRRARQRTLKMEMSSASRITVDTPAEYKAALAAMPLRTDTAKEDSTVVNQVAQVIHDSVKAELKAPIVQVAVTLRSLIVPGALFAYGAITLNNTGLRVFNDNAKNLIWNGQTFQHPYIEDYTLLVPAAAVYALNIFGVKGQNNLIDRSIIYGMSNAIANGIIFGVKQVGIETRPDGSDNHSFPSGHTAEAFVSAEFLHQEYKGRVHWSVIAAGYAVAVGTGYMRMYHNKHWLSDVVAGAGIGIASTRFSYYLYPAIKNLLFGSKTVRQEAMVFPVYQNTVAGNVYGLGLSYGF